MEGHAAIPDAEQVERIGQEDREVIEQHIADTSTEENAEETGIQQVFHFVFGPATARAFGATASQPHGKDETDQIHQAVPVKRDGSN